MESVAALEDDLAPLPDAKLIWLKAQFAQRRASAADALKPVDTFQRVAWGVSGLALFFGLLTKWTLLEHAVVWLNAGWGSLVSQTGWAGLLLAVSILTLGLVGAASLFSLDRVFGGRGKGAANGITGGRMKKHSHLKNLPILLTFLLTVGCGRFDERLVGEFQHHSSDGSRRLQIASSGKIEFTEDERDIQHISPGGHFAVLEKRGFTTRRLEIEPGPDGKLTRSYTYRGEPIPFDEGAKAWLAELIQGLIRDDGFEAPSRVQRILQRQGPAAVLDEITRIKNGQVKSIYFEELAKSNALDLTMKQRIINQASKEISSDGEKAVLLERLVGHFWNDVTLRESLIVSVDTLHSDGEKARLLSHVLEKPNPTTRDLVAILGVVERISSDGEKSSLLQLLAPHYSGTDALRTSFFRAANTLRSDGERRQALGVLLQNKALGLEDLVEGLESVAYLSSDGEKASMLVEMTKLYKEDAALRSAFFKATDTLSSDGEHRRVLSELLKIKPAPETLQAVLQSTKGISSDGEKAALLTTMAKECVSNEELLAKFLEVTNSLQSDGEYRTVMSRVFEDTNFLKKVALQKPN